MGALAAQDNPVMFNRYAYANNNPYAYVDPDGGSPVSNFHDGLRLGAMSGAQIQAVADFRYRTLGGLTGVTDAVDSSQRIMSGDFSGAALSLLTVLVKPAKILKRFDKVAKGADAIGTSKKGLKHIGKHTDEFKAFDKSFTLEKQVDLGKQIASNPKNLVNEVNGSKGYEANVKIGESNVRVRSVVNSSGNLRTVYPVK